MKIGIIVFPGTNRERDLSAALSREPGVSVVSLWSDEPTLPGKIDAVILPGGYSYGDYLRPGAIAARAPIIPELVKHIRKGMPVLGICNGFQVLIELGLLPGALIRNTSLRFVCRSVDLEVTSNRTPFLSAFAEGKVWPCPVAHHDGCYFIDQDGLKRLREEEQIVLRYANGTNPNGSLDDIAGICSPCGRIMGMMPHPENQGNPSQKGWEGRLLFQGLKESCKL